MEFVTGQRQVVMNFSEVYCKTETEILNSACFREVWKKYINHIKKTQKQDILKTLRLFPKPEVDYIKLFKFYISYLLYQYVPLFGNFKISFGFKVFAKNLLYVV